MNLSTRKLVVTSMLGAISIVLGVVPNLGIIPIPPFGATIMHIPIIIGAIAEGPIVGLLIGLIFGGFSMYQAATMSVSPISVVFLDPLVAILPRILIGITTYYTYRGIKWTGRVLKHEKAWELASIAGAAAVGSLTNTVGVFSMIYFRHAAKYMELIGESIGTTVATVGIIQGLTEMVVAMIITAVIVRALKKVYKNKFS